MDDCLIHPIRIGDLTLDTNVVAAPMAHCTSLPFRVLAREQGCAMAWAEMVSAEALVAGAHRVRPHLETAGEPRPHAAQISGSDPSVMAEAARIVEAMGFDTVDVNMGCPCTRLTDRGAGAALMRDPARATQVVEAVTRAVRIPVTVKMRAGWDLANRNATEIARAVEAAGARMVTVHGRTRADLFGVGTNDLAVIALVKQTVLIPVIGNGDVLDPVSAERMLRETGCDGISVGRAACGDPWVFARIRAWLADGVVLPPPAPREALAAILRHFEMFRGYLGDGQALTLMRSHAPWYVKGVPGAASLRDRLGRARTQEEFVDMVRAA